MKKRIHSVPKIHGSGLKTEVQDVEGSGRKP
jgi:hypothetical protein